MSGTATHVIAANARQTAGSLVVRGRRSPSLAVPQELFRDALVRERKRADRFEETLVVVLITLNDRDVLSRWRRVVRAASHTTVDADLIGWFEQGSILGLIRSVTDNNPEETAQTLRENLMRRLTREHVESCSIHSEIYSPHRKGTSRVFLEGGAEDRKSQETVQVALKRALDIVGSLAFLIAFSPLFLFVAALVKLTSRGPVLFRQQRVGEGGRPFMMFKFRTMRVDADHRIHQQYVESYIQSGAMNGSDKRAVFKIVHDPRVTPFGNFLRRSSLDEFPQFWNVLRGEMSLVGPRPPISYEVARYKGWHRRRVLEAKPGITGLWQVTGRSRTTFDEMVRLDLRYARNHSVWTDLKLLLATPFVVISGKGAH